MHVSTCTTLLNKHRYMRRVFTYHNNNVFNGTYTHLIVYLLFDMQVILKHVGYNIY